MTSLPPPILLINPNSSEATTRMMVEMARAAAGPGHPVLGVTARNAPAMITSPEALDACEAEVVALGIEGAGDSAAVIVGAFGDPGVTVLRGRIARPVFGLCEASMTEAAAGGRRFGVATTTPQLVGRIDARAESLGFAGLYAGTRLAYGDPLALSAEPERLVTALAATVRRLEVEDGVDAVIIGGGPLSHAAAVLLGTVGLPVVIPVLSAVRQALAR